MSDYCLKCGLHKVFHLYTKDTASCSIAYWTVRAKAADIRIAKLEAALGPFARIANETVCWRDKHDDYPAWALDNVILTVDNFRNAAKVLAKGERDDREGKKRYEGLSKSAGESFEVR